MRRICYVPLPQLLADVVVIAGIAWFIGTSADLCLYLHMCPPVRVPLGPHFTLPLWTPVMLDVEPSLLQCDLILTISLCSDPISQ